MKTKDGGESAFPTLTQAGDLAVTQGGLTVRDYFAAHAPITLQDAIKTCGYPDGHYIGDDDERRTVFVMMAMLRTEYADAMIAELREEELTAIQEAAIATGGKL